MWNQHRVQQTAFSTKGNGTILIKKGVVLSLLFTGDENNTTLCSNLLLTFPVELVNERRPNFSDAKQILCCLNQKDWKNKYRCVLKFRELSLSESLHLPLS